MRNAKRQNRHVHIIAQFAKGDKFLYFRCVLKMDHHCVWIGACVGYYNHGHFLRFLLYINLACSATLVLLCKRLYMISTNAHIEQKISSEEIVFVVLDFVLCTVVNVSVGILSALQILYALKNETNIEVMQKEKLFKLREVGKDIRHQDLYPYDAGVCENLKSILGSNPILWWLPMPLSPVRKYPENPYENEDLWDKKTGHAQTSRTKYISSTDGYLVPDGLIWKNYQ